MNIHEHQAKALLRKFGVPTSEGKAVFSIDEVVPAALQMKGPPYVLKAQIHAGGRGAGHFAENPKAGGGVRIAKTKEELESAAKEMLGNTLVTKQTGAKGKQVKRLYVEEACAIDQEFYLSLLIDRSNSSVGIVASAQGGMNIEEVAEKNPDAIATINVDAATGIMPFHIRRIAAVLPALSKDQLKSLGGLCRSLFRAFTETDASLIEINPLVLTKNGDFLVLDAKISLDDNALFRHPDFEELHDPNEEEDAEQTARKFDLSYIKLDGNIGCMVNGAGLAMATMDIIKLKGDEPANFLDVGGGATAEKVTQAFNIILSDKNVKAILVNIFGGIMRCDIIAEGILAAAAKLSLSVPLVVRLAGTNVEKGREILANSDIKIITADNLDEAASKAVAAAKQS